MMKHKRPFRHRIFQAHMLKKNGLRICISHLFALGGQYPDQVATFFSCDACGLIFKVLDTHLKSVSFHLMSLMLKCQTSCLFIQTACYGYGGRSFDEFMCATCCMTVSHHIYLSHKSLLYQALRYICGNQLT